MITENTNQKVVTPSAIDNARRADLSIKAYLMKSKLDDVPAPQAVAPTVPAAMPLTTGARMDLPAVITRPAPVMPSAGRMATPAVFATPASVAIINPSGYVTTEGMAKEFNTNYKRLVSKLRRIGIVMAVHERGHGYQKITELYSRHNLAKDGLEKNAYGIWQPVLLWNRSGVKTVTKLFKWLAKPKQKELASLFMDAALDRKLKKAVSSRGAI